MEQHILNASMYCDPKKFRREFDYIREKSWLIACHISQIPRVGDYYLFQHLDDSIIIARHQPNDIRAFRNRCLHRGSYLVDQAGHCGRLRCPYHGWTYDLQGALVASPGHTTTVTQRLDPITITVFGGFVWIYLGTKPPDLMKTLGVTSRYFTQFNAESLLVFKRRRFLLDCNWKTYLENILDSYHIASVHNTLLNRMTKVTDLEIIPEGRNLVLRIPIGDYKWRTFLDGKLAGIGMREDVTRYYHKIHILPNVVINFTALNATLYNIWPIADGKTLVEYTFFRMKSVNPLTYLRSVLIFLFSMKINSEDNAILPAYFANVKRFPGIKHKLVNAEASLIALHRNLRRYLP